MIVIDADGNEHNWKMPKPVLNDDKRKRSGLHVEARQLIKEAFPLARVYEEVNLPGTGHPPLKADFYLCSFNTIIEVQGEQHYNFSEFFHKDKFAWLRAKRLDRIKREWCELNNIEIVELPYDRREQWRELIAGICK